MQIDPESKQKIQLVLAIAIAVAAVRAGYIVYQRHSGQTKEAQKKELPLNPDYYVSPKKPYPFDLKSARQLMNQPVWVKEGYHYTYYHHDPAHHRTDFAHEAGTLLPLQRLQIKDVMTDVSPDAPDQRQVMAVFQENGKTYAFPIGAMKGNDFRVYSDEMLFIQDPHELYKHWPADMWQSIDKHEVKPGMNELQVDFAIGMGMPERSGEASVKTVKYPNGGKPLTVTYRDGKAVEVKPGSSA